MQRWFLALFQSPEPEARESSRQLMVRRGCSGIFLLQDGMRPQRWAGVPRELGQVRRTSRQLTMDSMTKLWSVSPSRWMTGQYVCGATCSSPKSAAPPSWMRRMTVLDARCSERDRTPLSARSNATRCSSLRSAADLLRSSLATVQQRRRHPEGWCCWCPRHRAARRSRQSVRCSHSRTHSLKSTASRACTAYRRRPRRERIAHTWCWCLLVGERAEQRLAML